MPFISIRFQKCYQCFENLSFIMNLQECIFDYYMQFSHFVVCFGLDCDVMLETMLFVGAVCQH